MNVDRINALGWKPASAFEKALNGCTPKSNQRSNDPNPAVSPRCGAPCLAPVVAFGQAGNWWSLRGRTAPDSFPSNGWN